MTRGKHCVVGVPNEVQQWQNGETGRSISKGLFPNHNVAQIADCTLSYESCFKQF